MTRENELYVRDVVEETEEFQEARDYIINQLENVGGDIRVFVKVPPREVTNFHETEHTPLMLLLENQNESYRGEVGTVTIETNFFVNTGPYSGRHVDYELSSVTIELDENIIDELKNS